MPVKWKKGNFAVSDKQTWSAPKWRPAPYTSFVHWTSSSADDIPSSWFRLSQRVGQIWLVVRKQLDENLEQLWIIYKQILQAMLWLKRWKNLQSPKKKSPRLMPENSKRSRDVEDAGKSLTLQLCCFCCRIRNPAFFTAGLLCSIAKFCDPSSTTSGGGRWWWWL